MVIRYSHFLDDPFGHGGEKRTAQISEILEENNFRYSFLESKWNLLSLHKKALCILKGIQYWDTSSKYNKLNKRFTDFGRIRNLVEEIQKEYANAKLFLWESTFPHNYFALKAAKIAGFKVIACPHNLESLVPGQQSYTSGKPSPKWLGEELRALSLCDAVFTISHEETWLLNLHGIKSHFLPYSPPRKGIEDLLRIRKKRKNSTKDHFFIIGSASNFPTKRGMEDLINLLGTGILDVTFKIAGFGTEHLYTSTEKNPNIELIGSLSKEDLVQELTSSRAVIVHQIATSGILTRITDFLTAGVPVICNYPAGRSYYGLPGVHVYDNTDDLYDLLHSELPTPSAPEPISKWVKTFVDQVGRSLQ